MLPLLIPPTPALWWLLAMALIGVALLGWLVRKVLRSNFALATWDYFSQSFEDARDRPDAKLLTLFSAFALVILIVVWGLFTHYWPPEYVLPTLVAFIAAGYGFSAQENRAKIAAEGAVEQAKITGQNTTSEPTSATTTTTTTLGPE